MSKRRSQQMQALDRHLGDRGLSRRAQIRIRSSIRQQVSGHKQRQRFALAGMFAMGLATAAAILLVSRWHVPSHDEPTGESLLAGSSVVEPRCHVQTNEPSRIDAGCRLEVHRVSTIVLTVWDETSIRERADGIDMDDGWIMFEVAPVVRPEGERVRIGVPNGTIEVIGTRFSVRAIEARGEIVLYEGRIRFVHENGAVSAMVAGQTLEWTPHGIGSGPPEATADPSPVTRGSSPRSPNPATTPGRAARLRPRSLKQEETVLVDDEPAVEDRFAQGLGQVEQLRATGRYARALVVLDALDAMATDHRTREVLSFERGTLLELVDVERACAHWREHLERFVNGRYTAEIARHRTTCVDSRKHPTDSRVD